VVPFLLEDAACDTARFQKESASDGMRVGFGKDGHGKQPRNSASLDFSGCFSFAVPAGEKP
jgi:hypothetical protein